jgi:membrane protein
MYDATLDKTTSQASDPQPLAARVWGLMRQTVQEWQEDKVPTQAAALAYYTVFALAPLLLVVLAVAGLFTSADAARDRLIAEISGFIGQDGGAWVRELLDRASSNQGSSILSVVIGTGGLLLGASGAFGQLQAALNTIWGTKPPVGIGALVRARAMSFGIVLIMGFLLLVSLTLSAALSALSDRIGLEPGAGWVWSVVYEVVNLGLTTFLFAMIYRFLPDSRVRWRDAFVGGAFTAVLFNIGKALIGLYLGRSTSASVFGAAGTLAVLLLWVYYASQIILFGAEFTQVYAARRQRNPSTAEPAPAEHSGSEVMVRDSSLAQVRLERLESNPGLRLVASLLTLGALFLAWRGSRKRVS